MRKWVLLALFALFYFASFPSLTVTDLLIISFLAIVGIVIAAKTLFALLTNLVEEAYDANIDSFISRSWAKYKVHGFNKQMTYRLAKCFIVIVCMKYGFDIIKHAAEHVPSVASNAFYAEVAGAVVVLFFVTRERVWLKLASNFRRDTQGKERLGFAKCYKLYLRPVGVCCAVLYAPAMLRGLVALIVQGIVILAPESALFAAPIAKCATTVVY